MNARYGSRISLIVGIPRGARESVYWGRGRWSRTSSLSRQSLNSFSTLGEIYCLPQSKTSHTLKCVLHCESQKLASMMRPQYELDFGGRVCPNCHMSYRRQGGNCFLVAHTPGKTYWGSCLNSYWAEASKGLTISIQCDAQKVTIEYCWERYLLGTLTACA